MRGFLFLLFFIAIPFLKAQAIAPDTVFLDQNFLRVPSRAAAAFYSFTTYSDPAETVGLTEVFYLKGQKESVEHFTVERKKKVVINIKKEGVQSYYYENGKLRNQVNYSQGLMEGQNTHWLPDGRVLRIANYRLGLPDGEAYTYYPNRKIKRKEIFKTGLLMEGKCFTKTGADTVFYAFEEQPAFAGGEAGLHDFLRKNIIYPKMAMRNGIEGMVVIQFVVSKTGEIIGTEVVKKVGFGLEEEGLRIVELLKGKFTPARLDGNPISFKYTLPIRFGMR